MNVIFDDDFFKKLKKLNNPSLIAQLNKVVTKILEAKKIEDIPNLKKLSGFSTYYRIRSGQYRIGVKIQAPDVIIIVMAHRSNIYNIFPPK